MDRITTTYKTGKGDLGFSDVLANQPPLRKDSPACKVQGAIELTRHAIEKVLCLDYLPPNLRELINKGHSSNFSINQSQLNHSLNWLNRNIFALGAFCYCGGDSTKYVLPYEFLTFLDTETGKLKDSLENAPDFLYQSHPLLVHLDGVRAWVRFLESAYVRWWYSKEVTQGIARSVYELDRLYIQQLGRSVYSSPTSFYVVDYSWWKQEHIQELLSGEDSILRRIVQNGAVLNRLSAYLFWATRMEAQLISQKDPELVEKHWTSGVEPFNPYN